MPNGLRSTSASAPGVRLHVWFEARNCVAEKTAFTRWVDLSLAR